MALSTKQTIVETTTNAGGETKRLATGERSRTHAASAIEDRIVNLADGNATTVTLYDWANSPVTSPRGVTLILDPLNTYDDNAATDPPLVIVEVKVTDTDGSTAPISQFHVLRREKALVLGQGQFRSALTAATNDKILRLIQARNKNGSGTGALDVQVRVKVHD